MKKIFIVLLALALSLSAALAEESPSLPEGNAKAPVVLWSQFAPVDFRTAVNAAEEPVSIGGDIDYLSLVTFKAGKHVRMVTLLDDRARELYMAAMARDAADNAYDVFSDYAWSLPVTYVEEITQKPKKQAELDALTGKTVADALQQGYVISGSGGGLYIPTTVDLAFGMFDYTFEADARKTLRLFPLLFRPGIPGGRHLRAAVRPERHRGGSGSRRGRACAPG